jgi:hypothetical protein
MPGMPVARKCEGVMKGLSWQERQGAVAVELARRADDLTMLADVVLALGIRNESLGRVAVILLRAAERLTGLSHRLGRRRVAPPVGEEQPQQADRSAEQLLPIAA